MSVEAAKWRTYTGAEFADVTEITCHTIANGYLIDADGDPIHENTPEIADEITRRGKAYLDHAFSWPLVTGCNHGRTTEDFDAFQLSDDGGQTWHAVTRGEYLIAQEAAGHSKRDGSPYLAFSNGDAAGRMYPLTKPSVEIRNFADIEFVEGGQ